jgi:hypothetical protein
MTVLNIAFPWEDCMAKVVQSLPKMYPYVSTDDGGLRGKTVLGV